MARVTNVVATAELGCQLKLAHIKRILPVAVYNPQKFSGLLIRITVPCKAHCQLYGNGKITINGGQSVALSHSLAQQFADTLNNIGYSCVVTNFRVVNIVGNCDFKRTVDLNECSKHFGVVFEREIFPGLSIKLSYCTAVLFRTGKCNFLGCKREIDVYSSYLELFAELLSIK